MALSAPPKPSSKTKPCGPTISPPLKENVALAEKLSRAGHDAIAATMAMSSSQFSAAPVVEFLRNEKARAGSAASLVDLGCGRGFLARTANELGWRYTGIDHSPALFAEAAERARKVNGCIALGSICALPFPDGMFHLAMAWASLPFLPKEAIEQRALPEMRRVLRPSGTALVVMHAGRGEGVEKSFRRKFWVSRYEEDEFAKLAERVGLAVVNVLPNHEASGFIGFVLRRDD